MKEQRELQLQAQKKLQEDNAVMRKKIEEAQKKVNEESDEEEDESGSEYETGMTARWSITGWRGATGVGLEGGMVVLRKN